MPKGFASHGHRLSSSKLELFLLHTQQEKLAQIESKKKDYQKALDRLKAETHTIMVCTLLIQLMSNQLSADNLAPSYRRPRKQETNDGSTMGKKGEIIVRKMVHFAHKHKIKISTETVEQQLDPNTSNTERPPSRLQRQKRQAPPSQRQSDRLRLDAARHDEEDDDGDESPAKTPRYLLEGGASTSGGGKGKRKARRLS
jgi:hypothetical protein